MNTNSGVSDFGKDLGLMHEVVVTGRKAGFTPEDWGKLAHDQNLLNQVFRLIRSRAEIKMIEPLINCDEKPFIPEGLSILPESEQLPNRVRGLYKLDITKVRLHLSEEQKKRGEIEGNELRKKLKKEAVLPANVLDFLLKKENQHLIPKEIIPKKRWEGKRIFFWGTIYRDSHDLLRVRCLYWDVNGLNWSSEWLGNYWSDRYPSVVSASN